MSALVLLVWWVGDCFAFRYISIKALMDDKPVPITHSVSWIPPDFEAGLCRCIFLALLRVFNLCGDFWVSVLMGLGIFGKLVDPERWENHMPPPLPNTCARALSLSIYRER